MRRVIGALAAMCAVVAVAGCAGASTPGGTQPEVNLAFEKYTLGNGLEVILRKDDRAPIASVNLWYHVGPANETAGRTGFAHLFEHMMFQGSGHTAADAYFPMLKSVGATNVNATTASDRTNYHEDVPPNALERALWLESDRMGFLLDSLDAAQLANQQSVVRNERRENREQPPYALSGEAMIQHLFPEGHPYHGHVIGSHADIQAARLDDVRDFFTRYYVPNNASLAIVGKIDVPATKAMIEKYFGPIRRGADVPTPRVTVPRLTAEQRLTVTDTVELPSVTMAWVTSPIYTPGDAEADLVAKVLGSGQTSRLHQALVRRDRIAQSVSASQRSQSHGSIFTISATAAPGHSPEELEAAVQRELDRLAVAGPTPTELANAKTIFQSGLIFGLEHPAAVADLLNHYNHFVGDPGYLNRDIERYGDVTVPAFRRFVTEQLPSDRRVVVRTVPGAKVLPPDPPEPTAPAAAAGPKPPSAEPWRDAVPALGPSAPMSLPGAERFQLDNGLPVFLVVDHDLPLASAQLVTRWGTAADPAGKPGVASFSTDMLAEGTPTRDSDGIALELETLGASSLGTSTGLESSSIGVSALTTRLDQAVTVMADAVLNPTFPQVEMDRIRDRWVVSIQQSRDEPSSVAADVMDREIYGPGHRIGTTSGDLVRSLPTITQEDLRQFHRTAFTPSNSALVLAGDLTPAQARALAEKHFGAWRGAATPPPELGPPAPSAEQVFDVDRPGAGQTTLLMVQGGMAIDDADEAKLTVLNEVLGGSFSGRLNLNLRERHGYTYGASSGLITDPRRGELTLSTSAKTEFTGATVREMRAEVAALQDAPVTVEELQRAKDSLTRSLPASFVTTSGTANIVAGLYLAGEPADYYAKLPAELAGVTAEDVQAVARKYLRPGEMKLVAVGDRGQIESQLAGAGLGPVAHRTVDAQPQTP